MTNEPRRSRADQAVEPVAPGDDLAIARGLALRRLVAPLAQVRIEIGGDTVPFVGGPKIPNRDYVLQVQTPAFAQFSGNLFLLWGHDENFLEWASAALTLFNAGLDWRPTDKLRLSGTYQLQRVGRRTDGSTVNIQHIPRLKLEYQVSRPVFLRLVGEYASERQDALRDYTRTEAPLLIFDPEVGDFVRATAFDHRSFRGDLLFSYQPNPGTVLFAGYGSTLRDPVDPHDPLRTGLRRSDDPPDGAGDNAASSPAGVTIPGEAFCWTRRGAVAIGEGVGALDIRGIGAGRKTRPVVRRVGRPQIGALLNRPELPIELLS